MTFLEWLITDLSGEPPTSEHGDGESTWDCPQCGHPRFHSMPDRPGFRHRVRCWRCDFRGDAADMLRWFRPVEGESYPELCNRLNVWRHRYEQEANRKGFQFHRGPGHTKPPHVCIRCKLRDGDYHAESDEFEPEADAAIQELLAYLTNPPTHRALMETLRLSEKTLRICAEHGLHPLALAGRCGFEVWTREHEHQHMMECVDDDCDWRCCRLARGWTEEEIAADIEATQRKHTEQLKAKLRGGNGRAA